MDEPLWSAALSLRAQKKQLQFQVPFKCSTHVSQDFIFFQA